MRGGWFHGNIAWRYERGNGAGEDVVLDHPMEADSQLGCQTGMLVLVGVEVGSVLEALADCVVVVVSDVGSILDDNCCWFGSSYSFHAIFFSSDGVMSDKKSSSMLIY